jgi:hydroxymethylpyrimidine pyrophosphatase-like HAD family hydrolase
VADSSTFTPKLLALDIDGTILVPEPGNGFSADEVTPQVREAVDRAVEAGLHVVLASGRSPLSMSGVLRHLDLPRHDDE